MFFYLWLYARMRAKASPAVLGWLFPKEGGVWGRAKESIVCGMWVVVGMWRLSSRRRRCVGGGVFGYMPAEGGRCMQSGEVQAGATA